MNKLKLNVTLGSSIRVILLGILGGVLYFLSPIYGVDYSAKPKQKDFGTSTETIKGRKKANDISIQWNLDLNKNPKPTLEEIIMPVSICSTTTHTDQTEEMAYEKTSDSNALKDVIQNKVNNAQTYPESLNRPEWSMSSLGEKCKLPTNNKVAEAKLETQGLASDESPRGFTSIFESDLANIETAQVRNKKVSNILSEINIPTGSVLKIAAQKAEEKQFEPGNVKQLLEREFPMGKDLERLEILSKIAQSDGQYTNDQNLRNLLNQHRGVKISTVKEVQTQQIVTLPAPIAMTPLFLLVPSVRVATFSSVRIVFSASLFVFNRLTQLAIFLLEKFSQLSVFLLRVLRIALRNLRRKTKQLIAKSKVWADAFALSTMTAIQNETRKARIRFYLLQRKIERLITETQKSVKLLNLHTSRILNNAKQFVVEQAVHGSVNSLIFALQVYGVLEDTLQKIKSKTLLFLVALNIQLEIVKENGLEAMEAFQTATKWNLNEFRDNLYNGPKKLITQLLSLQKSVDKVVGIGFDHMVRGVIQGLINLVSTADFIINYLDEADKFDELVEHDFQSLPNEIVAQKILSTIDSDFGLGHNNRAYHFNLDQSQVVELFVAFYPNEGTEVVFQNTEVKNLYNFSCARFSIRKLKR
ncbi:MAG: hypothetical protein ACRCXZ_00370 [Patescibacteria group bacterium]